MVLRKKSVLVSMVSFLLVLASNFVYGAKFELLSWEKVYESDNGNGYATDEEKYTGKYSLVIEGDNESSKCFFAPREYFSVQPGEKYVVSAYVKSEGTKKDGTRIGAWFYDSGRKKIGDTHGNYCGGEHDWEKVSEEITIPDNCIFIRPIVCVYLSKRKSYFDEVMLVKKGTEENLVKDGGFEEVIDAPQGWRIPVRIKNKDIDIDGLVEITDLSVNEHLVHYRGGDNISGLTMNCKYNVLRPANCYLNSSSGSQYWHVFNIRELKESHTYSDEMIDLRKRGSNECIVKFTTRDNRYMDEFSKGLNCVRGHHYFNIMDFNNKFLGGTVSVDALVSPEKSEFGSGLGVISEFNKGGIFTLANLEKYEIGIVDFRSNWEKGGWFTFKVEVVDADGDKYEIDRADVEIAGEYQATDKKEKLNVEQVFDEDDVPVGYFQGRIGKEVPDKIIIRIVTKAATPRGLEIKKTEKVVKRGEGRTGNMPVVKKKPVEPDKEARGACFEPPLCFDKNPEVGKKQVKELVSKAKKMNLNMLFPFAILNRGQALYNTSNKYFKKVFPDWDPLAELISEAHKEGIQVHAIVCLLPEGAETLKGILTEHPEWAMDGGKRGWLDPAVPEVKEYRVNNILEIVKNYEVDGILLDYARLTAGPSNKGAEIYQKEFGIDPRGLKEGDEEYKKWFIWEGNQLTDLVSKINQEIHKIKPNIVFSAYVQGDKYAGNNKYHEYHQHFADWMAKGYLDMINPTGYVYDMLRFRCWTNRQIQVCRKANPVIPIYPCIGVHSSGGRLTAEGVVRQVEICRELGADGVIFFTWPALEPYADYVKEKVFNKKAGIPDLKKGKEK